MKISMLQTGKILLLSAMLLGGNGIVKAAGKPFANYNEVYPIKNEAFGNYNSFITNNNSVKVYLNVPKKQVHVIAKDNKGKQIDFFVFDLEGTLVHNHKMKTKDHHKINDLNRGVYVYRVFCGDEETASGQFEIK